MDYIKIRFGDEIAANGTDGIRRFEEDYHSFSHIFRMARSAWKPQVDICESGNEVLVRAALAGVDEENLAVEISPRLVRISGHRQSGEAGADHTYLQAEIRCGRFERLLYLPSVVNTGNVRASFANGLLTLHLVKSTSGEA